LQYAIELSQQQTSALQRKAAQLSVNTEDLLQSLLNQVLARIVQTIDLNNEPETHSLGHFQKPESAPSEIDPIEKFIGIAYSENPDWIEKHDRYLGQEAFHSQGK